MKDMGKAVCGFSSQSPTQQVTNDMKLTDTQKNEEMPNPKTAVTLEISHNQGATDTTVHKQDKALYHRYGNIIKIKVTGQCSNYSVL